MIALDHQTPCASPYCRCSYGRIFFGLCASLFIFHVTLITFISYDEENSWRNRIRMSFGSHKYRNLLESKDRKMSVADNLALAKCKSLNISTEMILIRGGAVYTPDFIGNKDVLIAGGKILKLFDPGDDEADRLATSRLVIVLNASDAAVVPGLVDIHVHVTGGGGEAGPGSRVPEAPLSQLLRGGLTTVVGVLGMDSVTRSPDVLLAKVTALNRGAITAFMWTGAYSVLPEVPTVTGSIQRDLALISTCIGVKVAISDHRASQAGPSVFRGIAGQAQVGGMVGGKPGLVYFHVGAHPDGLGPLWDIVRNTATPPGQLLPTHMGRTDALIRDGIAWALAGGAVDVSANSRAPAAVEAYLAAGVPPERISVSSDAFGSLPKFDSEKRLVAYSYARPDRLLRFLRDMALGRGWALERALPLVTRNPARRAGLAGKGVLLEGGDADVLVLGRAGLEPRFLLAKGALVLAAGPVAGARRDCVDTDMFEGAA